MFVRSYISKMVHCSIFEVIPVTLCIAPDKYIHKESLLLDTYVTLGRVTVLVMGWVCRKISGLYLCHMVGGGGGGVT